MPSLFHASYLPDKSLGQIKTAMLSFAYAADLMAAGNGHATDGDRMEWWARREYARCRDELAKRREHRTTERRT